MTYLVTVLAASGLMLLGVVLFLADVSAAVYATLYLAGAAVLVVNLPQPIANRDATSGRSGFSG